MHQGRRRHWRHPSTMGHPCLTVLMHRLGLSLGMLTPIMLWRACPSYSRPVASTGSFESIVDHADIRKKNEKENTENSKNLLVQGGSCSVSSRSQPHLNEKTEFGKKKWGKKTNAQPCGEASKAGLESPRWGSEGGRAFSSDLHSLNESFGISLNFKEKMPSPGAAPSPRVSTAHM